MRVVSSRWSVVSVLLSATLFGLCSSIEAQQASKVARIGYISATDRVTDLPRVEGLRTALRDLGYLEGTNIVIEYRYGAGKRDQAPIYLAELVRLNVDAIVVSAGDPWIEAAKNATKTIPIIIAGQGSDPIKSHFIESLAHPGGNVTGFTAFSNELVGND